MYKKYKLKPGRHQFAPRSPAVHTNDNTGDEEAEWYLQKYPHIAQLFVEKLEGCNVAMLGEIESNQIEHCTTVKTDEATPDSGLATLQPSNIQTLQQTNEDLFTTN